MHGKGVRTWPNGARFEGNFLDGMAHGKGKFNFPNGDCYDGDFRNDLANGYGAFTDNQNKSVKTG
jgi:hypothetical protein